MDSSALDTAVSVLQNSISSLETSIDGLEKWLWISSAAVAIGVMFEIAFLVREYSENRHSWRRGILSPPSRPSLRVLVLEALSVAVVVAGVVGELWVGVVSANRNADLRSKNNRLISLVRAKAGNAEVSAGKANAKAAELLRVMAPRDLTETQQRDIRVALLHFKGLPTIFIRSFPGDGEAARLIILLKNAMAPGINLVDKTGQMPADVSAFEKISIDPSKNERSIAETIRRVLHEKGGLDINEISQLGGGSGPTEIIVGFKPVVLLDKISEKMEAATGLASAHINTGISREDSIAVIDGVATPDLKKGLNVRVRLTGPATLIAVPKLPLLSEGEAVNWTLSVAQDSVGGRSVRFSSPEYELDGSQFQNQSGRQTVLPLRTDRFGQTTLTGIPVITDAQ